MATSYKSEIKLNFSVPDLDTLGAKETAINTYVTNRADGSYFTYAANRASDGSIGVVLLAYINVTDFADFSTVRTQMNTWVANNVPTAIGSISYDEGFDDE